ncbi:MAG: sigma-70 region 4 domain-containing protein [Oscillospiraceae bacterium]|nr:sigma-70 region 4 domain-containing protein [Oscillospiraceae bacterium]
MNEIARKRLVREIEEIENDIMNTKDEKERWELFKELEESCDNADFNNDRKHFRSERRDRYNITTMGNAFSPDNMESYIPKRLLKACKAKDWDEIIFTGEVDNLTDIAMDRSLAYILQELPQAQREVFYYRVVEGYTAQEIADIKGTTTRNIRKLYEKSLNRIRADWLPVVELKRKFETDEKYRQIVREQDIYTTEYEREYLNRVTEIEETA